MRKDMLAYINPTTAMILIIEKTNSASPYPLTPKRLILYTCQQASKILGLEEAIYLMIRTKNTVTQTAGCTALAPSQYDIVMEAATISSGRHTSQDRA